jgi:hypothetical protein
MRHHSSTRIWRPRFPPEQTELVWEVRREMASVHRLVKSILSFWTWILDQWAKPWKAQAFFTVLPAYSLILIENINTILLLLYYYYTATITTITTAAATASTVTTTTTTTTSTDKYCYYFCCFYSYYTCCCYYYYYSNKIYPCKCYTHTQSKMMIMYSYTLIFNYFDRRREVESTERNKNSQNCVTF